MHAQQTMSPYCQKWADANTPYGVLLGIDSAPKHAARCRLQLAEFAVLECLRYQQLTQILPRLSQQVGQGAGSSVTVLG